jgi:lysyl-tRNA synthetase class 1
MHWFDELLPEVREATRGRDPVVINAGLSVSGLQHVGRLRGEVTLAHVVATALRDEGREVVQSLVLYTQDAWKGTADQRRQFPGDEGARYVSRRLIDVPDPAGCHANWVDHYWEDFGDHLEAFAPDVRVLTTTDLYATPAMRQVVRDVARRAEEVRVVMNRYRRRNPFPSGWTPFRPLCLACRRIGHAEALEVRDDEEVAYACACGDRGASPIEMGKLNWRVEWAALWKVLDVAVEPFGKDHASPGGSRDNSKALAQTILGFEPPFGIPYEWVGLATDGTDLGDMSSSAFKGIGVSEWLALADPEVLRFLYLVHPTHRRIVLDLGKVDAYHDQFDGAEAAHFAATSSDDGTVQARSYALALLEPLPDRRPFRIAYRHAAFLSQIAPAEDRVAWCLRRLRDTGMLTRDLDAFERDCLARRLAQAAAWVTRHAPGYRVTLLDTLSDDVRARLDGKDRRALAALRERLAETAWTEEALKGTMVSLTGGGLPIDTKRFFRDLYLVLLGQEKGPRAAPFLAVLDRDWVLRRLDEACL